VLRSYLAELGLFIPGASNPEPSVFRKFLEQIQERPDAENIQIMLLRSMSQAEYTPENEGHFGLAFDAYTHFTSPIRRYPDLIVHRIIKAQVADKKVQSAAEKTKIKSLYNKQKLSEIGKANSITERNADLATRDVMDWLKCEYMQSRIGNTYTGEVSTVTNFGLFIRLDEVYVEGLIHVTELGNDYFHYDQSRQRMVGERSGKSYSIGDKVEIQVATVDIDLRRIDFSLVEKSYNKSNPEKPSEREKLYSNAKKKSQRRKKTTAGKNAGERKKKTSSSNKQAGGISLVKENRSSTKKNPSTKKKSRRKSK
jgi:ribonuclease R